MTGLVPQDLLAEEDGEWESRRLLAELADDLANATRDLVLGEVRTRYSGTRVEHEFSLRSVRTSYRYDLFWLDHGLDEFPVRVRGPWTSHYEQCEGPDQLRQLVGEVFADARTRKLIKELAKSEVP